MTKTTIVWAIKRSLKETFSLLLRTKVAPFVLIAANLFYKSSNETFTQPWNIHQFKKNFFHLVGKVLNVEWACRLSYNDWIRFKFPYVPWKDIKAAYKSNNEAKERKKKSNRELIVRGDVEIKMEINVPSTCWKAFLLIPHQLIFIRFSLSFQSFSSSLIIFLSSRRVASRTSHQQECLAYFDERLKWKTQMDVKWLKIKSSSWFHQRLRCESRVHLLHNLNWIRVDGKLVIKLWPTLFLRPTTLGLWGNPERTTIKLRPVLRAIR